MDYLRPYALAHPVQSFAVLEQEPEAEYGYDEQESPSGDGKRVVVTRPFDPATVWLPTSTFSCLFWDMCDAHRSLPLARVLPARMLSSLKVQSR